jgi:hypothetical protein
MQHRLGITTNNSLVREVQAETNLAPSHQLDFPETISGTLLNLTEAEILKLAPAQAP